MVHASVSSPSNVLENTNIPYAWDSGAISTQSISSGDGDGFVSVVADVTNKHRLFGLGNANSSASYEDLEFGLHLLDDGTMEILESGNLVQANVGDYQVGDVLKVGVHAGVVKYYRNDNVLYTSKTSPTFPLYLDTSIYTPGGRLVGALLCAGSSCTTSPTTPPYTSYYTFGGKMVGMRRANYSAGNGQLRIVDDRLGSTTLIVDTSLTVVQRQYSKPYGEYAWQYTATSSGGASLTNIGYTGQRTDEDSAGLLFYNARLYDPVLSFFVSADSIAADKYDPKTRNRYSYVMNNPLVYIDPTGHCSSQRGVDERTCEEAKATLNHYGFDVNLDEWSLEELEWMIEALEDLIRTIHQHGGTYKDYEEMLGIGGDLIMLVNVDTMDLTNAQNAAWYKLYGEQVRADNGGTADEHGKFLALSPSKIRDLRLKGGQANNITVKDYFKFVFVHELGHLMDARNGGKYTTGLQKNTVTGSAYTFCIGPLCLFPYDTYEPSVSNRGVLGGPPEDWAETVATEVYPGVKPDNDHGDWNPAPMHRAFADRVFSGQYK